MLRGENFLLRNRNAAIGFYCRRIVQAPNPEEAELKAVELVREDPELQTQVVNPLNEPPMIYLEEMTVFESWRMPKQFGGYTFFSGDDVKKPD